jgi:hypothetical protein
MAPRESYISLRPDQQAEIVELATTEGWRIVSRDSLPSVFPDSFRAKLDSAVLIVSGSVSGTTTLVCNASRVDTRAHAIDQEPFAVVVYPSGVSSGGMFVHHGDWPDRTSPAPDGFWNHVRVSGVSNYFSSHPPEGVTSGPLATLPIGQKHAFDAVVSRIAELGNKSHDGT